MWFVNVFLLLLYFFNPAFYASEVAAGAPCMAYYSWNVPTDPQPGCWYDPSNTNPFVPEGK